MSYYFPYCVCGCHLSQHSDDGGHCNDCKCPEFQQKEDE